MKRCKLLSLIQQCHEAFTHRAQQSCHDDEADRHSLYQSSSAASSEVFSSPPTAHASGPAQAHAKQTMSTASLQIYAWMIVEDI